MRTPKFFEEWAKRNYMKAVRIERDPDGDILLADSCEAISTREQDSWAARFANVFTKPAETRVYRTGYAIHRSGLEMGNYHDYPAGDFVLMSREDGIKQRTDEALAHARDTQTKLKDSGYYDAERKGRFSLRPH